MAKADELEKLQADLEAANAAGLEKDQQLKDALAVNEDLQAKVEELEMQLAASGKTAAPLPAKKAQLPTDSFKVGKENYVFTAPAFNLNGKKILATEALLDKDLLAELVEMGSGVIKRKGD